ncbi:SMP-30/gluconolactonase/LRE family protein [Spirillospora sp. CA-294931]|uniref:SMP-30/gluconolactonase/LRE family protein n=1 Tax=Spirillospora sp. CA-294931 TaxID=3240042 RepID=UPI003D8A0D4A
MPRVLRSVALAAALALVPLAPAHADSPVSVAHVLPGEKVYPEGIALDGRTGDLYAGSYNDGTVFKMTPGRRVAEIFLPSGTDGRRTANGLKVDAAGRLWVTDSTTGVSVYETRSKRLLARFDVPGTAGRFVNDLAIAPDGTAYLTDSVRAVIYKVTRKEVAKGGRAALTPWLDLKPVLEPHKPDAFTLNGIVADPSGRFLITADMTGGDLYRVDVATGAIHKIALRGGDAAMADGLEVANGRLWIVHNVDDRISRWRLSRDGRSARVVRQVTDEALQLPTTLVRRNGVLYVVRSQFDKGGPMGPGTPEIPFTIAAVRGI